MKVKVAHVAAVDLSLRFLLLNQLESLRDEGYSVAAISSAGPHVRALQDRDISHTPVTITRAISPVADLTALWRLYRIMRRERFTIVHCHTPKAELLGQLAARLAGVPIVVDTFRGLYHLAGARSARRWMLLKLTQLATACADLVLCQSQDAMETMVRSKLCPRDRVTLLGNGIDIRRFNRQRLDPQELAITRRDLGIAPNQPVVGFVGRLVREKGILDLFHAMRLVRERVADARLVVVGPIDSDKPDAVHPRLAADYGVAEACVFTSLRTDVPHLYALMDVFVLPSFRESFPRAAMEASAMEVPCVVTDIPGCRQVVDHDCNGLVVPTESPALLADAIVRLLTDKDAARRMGIAGRQKAIEQFDEEGVFRIVKAAYARLLLDKGIVVPPRVVPSPFTVTEGPRAYPTQP